MVPNKRSRWVRIGKQIRAARDRTGLSQEDVATALGMSPTMLSAMERGARGIKREHTVQLDRVLGTGSALVDLWDTSAESALPPWYQDAADLEKAAVEIWEYHPLLIPGVLQTEEYARHILTIGLPRESPAAIEGFVQARMGRQDRLDADNPPTWVFVVDESVLRRPTGGRSVMSNQLARLLVDAQRPNVSFQVVPFDTTHHPGLSNAFALFKVADKPGTVLYVETRRSGTPSSEQDAVDDYSRLFGDLRGAALPLQASRQLIEAIKEHHEPQ